MSRLRRPPTHAPAHEIDISNEWEDMIEVEPAESEATELLVQSYEEVAQEITERGDVEPGPAASGKAPGADLASQIADKVQEIRFYVTQEMWEPAKSAILDLTELAPDDPRGYRADRNGVGGAGKIQGPRPRHGSIRPVWSIESPCLCALAPAEIVEPQPRRSRQRRMCSTLWSRRRPSRLNLPKPATSGREKSTEDILGDFILDLEQSDLADFAPAPKQPARAAAAAAPPAAAAAPAMERRSNGDIQDAESANILSDILSELREETAEAAEPEEDPETHYNLGIAFKEMGLLDEAIGELQKVCHAVDRGAAFSQPIQALTWLAQCLVDKGAPEAAVRWYQKALQSAGSG